MNKTYIANENHPELKVGTKVVGTYDGWETPGGLRIAIDIAPVNKPDWYDKVVGELIVLEDEVNKILNKIAEEQYDGTLLVDPDKLATYLAKLEKRISK